MAAGSDRAEHVRPPAARPSVRRRETRRAVADAPDHPNWRICLSMRCSPPARAGPCGARHAGRDTPAPGSATRFRAAARPRGNAAPPLAPCGRLRLPRVRRCRGRQCAGPVPCLPGCVVAWAQRVRKPPAQPCSGAFRASQARRCRAQPVLRCGAPQPRSADSRPLARGRPTTICAFRRDNQQFPCGRPLRAGPAAACNPHRVYPRMVLHNRLC